MHREGRSAAQLAVDLFGIGGRAITARAEMSRLRKHFAGIVLAQPYRFDERAGVELLLPADLENLLPYSAAPEIVRARRRESATTQP